MTGLSREDSTDYSPNFATFRGKVFVVPEHGFGGPSDLADDGKIFSPRSWSPAACRYPMTWRVLN